MDAKVNGENLGTNDECEIGLPKYIDLECLQRIPQRSTTSPTPTSGASLPNAVASGTPSASSTITENTVYISPSAEIPDEEIYYLPEFKALADTSHTNLEADNKYNEEEVSS